MAKAKVITLHHSTKTKCIPEDSVDMWDYSLRSHGMVISARESSSSIPLSCPLQQWSMTVSQESTLVAQWIIKTKMCIDCVSIGEEFYKGILKQNYMSVIWKWLNTLRYNWGFILLWNVCTMGTIFEISWPVSAERAFLFPSVFQASWFSPTS